MNFAESARVAFSNSALTRRGFQQLCDVSAEVREYNALSRKNEVSAGIKHTGAMTRNAKKLGRDASAEGHEYNALSLKN